MITFGDMPLTNTFLLPNQTPSNKIFCRQFLPFVQVLLVSDVVATLEEDGALTLLWTRKCHGILRKEFPF